MKKLLLVLPLLLLIGCENNNTCICNVDYHYDYDLKGYRVIDNKGKNYRVLPDNFHEIKVDHYKKDGETIIYNEYYVVSERLLVYCLVE